MLKSNMLIHQRYRIVKLLKIGGMSEVYEAIDERINSRVALKRLILPHPTSQSLQAFKREATLLANLKHPSLPRVTDHFHDQQTPWLVMEFIPGSDLDELLQQRGRVFPMPMVMSWALQLCTVLNTLHTKTPPILHRDIKPQNLKVTAQDQVILLDFGLAKGSLGIHQGSTTQQSVLGYTLAYAPLEQIQGSRTDGRSDIYALAATLRNVSSRMRQMTIRNSVSAAPGRPPAAPRSAAG